MVELEGITVVFYKGVIVFVFIIIIQIIANVYSSQRIPDVLLFLGFLLGHGCVRLELILLRLCLEVNMNVSSVDRLFILLIYLDLFFLFLLYFFNSFTFLDRLLGLFLSNFWVKYKDLELVK